jgi:prophage regulatory protein
MSNAASPLRLLRLRQIIGDPKANPPIPAIIPVRKTKWFDLIKKGIIPPPKKLGPKISVWTGEQIEEVRRQIPQDAPLTPPVAAIEGAKRKRAAKRVALSHKPPRPTVPKPSTPRAPARRRLK